ncbi:hypothetical protein FRX31_003274 [Thalictrum thalictroides]|uniref:Transmembrane protein n=1 Tax=Thalictrum thalictroides TaxID=46969 RepID=A0A7J6XDQ3_THATH|nr:hypothetical protein FRX31_003274 [Thalictrum thalictroides]
MEAMNRTSVRSHHPHSGSGLPLGAIVGIIAACVLFVVALVWLVRCLQGRGLVPWTVEQATEEERGPPVSAVGPLVCLDERLATISERSCEGSSN